jgi:sRNA-binding carbon storage regulator CsrA
MNCATVHTFNREEPMWNRLLLARKPGEQIVLILPDGRTMAVQVTHSRNRQNIKVAFEAPQDVRIMRPEIAPELQGLHFVDEQIEDAPEGGRR